MEVINHFALLIYLVQLAHSVEELSTGFHSKWYLFKMSFWVFLGFEILFNIFWGAVLFFNQFPSREYLLVFFIALMFANGVQHIVWAGVVKKYVPGFITAPLHICLFLMFYYQIIFK